MVTEKNKNILHNRIWEIDFLRGVALLLMIYFHTIYDLSEFFNYRIQYLSGVNYYIGRSSAILFILISGVSSKFSKNSAKRGIYILKFAVILSIITLFVDFFAVKILKISSPNISIKFGILHLISISILLYTVLQKFNITFLITLSVIIIYSKKYAEMISISHDYFFPIGITSNNFYSSDYYPIIPWFGVFLSGVVLGKIFYKNCNSISKSYKIKENFINIIGRKSLFIYLIHQPVIILLLFIFNTIYKTFFI